MGNDASSDIGDVCRGRIEGAVKFGRVWVIPVNSSKPEDRRVLTGKYKNWRNNV